MMFVGKQGEGAAADEIRLPIAEARLAGTPTWHFDI